MMKVEMSPRWELEKAAGREGLSEKDATLDKGSAD